MNIITNEFTKEEFKISFIIPHLNYDKLEQTLKSIRYKTPAENIKEIILIDQNPEGYQQYADKYVDKHLYTKNLGFAGAANMGIRIAHPTSNFVAVWNDDCECIHSKWIVGMVETFNRYDNALCVNIGSPRNPSAPGASGVDHQGFEWRENFTEEEYDRMVTEVGRGCIYDGITMFAPIFNKKKLDQVGGVVEGCWFDERFFPGGGEDYDLCLRAYASGMRCLGTSLAYGYHWWYSTKHPDTGEAKVKFSQGFDEKWTTEINGVKVKSDIYGNYKDMNDNMVLDENGKQVKVKIEDIPKNIIRD